MENDMEQELYEEEEEESMSMRTGRSDDKQAYYRYKGDRRLPAVHAYGKVLKFV